MFLCVCVRAPLTCCSQADLEAASFELAAVLRLGHAELPALVKVGEETGEITVLAVKKREEEKRAHISI